MSDVAKTIEAVWKIEPTRLIAAIARLTHDIGIAEELAQDALVTALEVCKALSALRKVSIDSQGGLVETRFGH
jgi:predicted RNA polymerase sigma factor